MDKRVIITFLSTIIIAVTLLGIKACRKVCVPPVIAVSSNEVLINEELVFKANSDDAEEIQWNFGDGKTAMGNEVKHAYSAAGNYVVTAKSEETCVSTPLNIIVKVPAPKPIKRVPISIVMPEQLVTGNELTFTSETEGFNEYNWRVLETNQGSNESFLTISFNEAKQYTIKVSAKGEELFADSTFTINVIKGTIPPIPPIALNIIYPKVVTVGNNVNFICTTPYLSQYSWTIKESGQSFNTKSFVTKFDKAGLYSITLSVNGNLQGKSFSLNKNVSIMVKDGPTRECNPINDSELSELIVKLANLLSSDEEGDASEEWKDKITSSGKQIIVAIYVNNEVVESISLEQFKKKQLLANTYLVNSITSIKRDAKGCVIQINISANRND